MPAEKLSIRLWIWFWEIVGWIVITAGPVVALAMGIWLGLWWLLLILGTFLGFVTTTLVHVYFGARIDRRGYNTWSTVHYTSLAIVMWAGVLFPFWPFSQTRLTIYGWICLGITIFNTILFFGISEGWKQSHSPDQT
jgi:hypothetical protein